jgi:selenide,water dikinase
MTTLNKAAAEVITAGGGTGVSPVRAERSSAGQPGAAVPAWSVHALTDITGFGLIGHAREMALASDVSLVFQSANIPVLEGALDCIHAGYIPGGLKANRDFAECMVGYDPSVSADMRTLLFDPQTAGGLLISVAAEDAGPLTRALQDAGVPAVEIGEVRTTAKPLITIG